jgi:hypothetical protein
MSCSPTELQPFIDWVTTHQTPTREHVVGALAIFVTPEAPPRFYTGTLTYVTPPNTDAFHGFVHGASGSAALYVWRNRGIVATELFELNPDRVARLETPTCLDGAAGLVLEGVITDGSGTLIVGLERQSRFQQPTRFEPQTLHQPALQTPHRVPAPTPTLVQEHPLWPQLLTQLHVPRGGANPGPVNFPPALDDIMAGLHIHTMTYLMMDQGAAQQIRTLVENRIVHTVQNLSTYHETSAKGAAVAA